MYAGFQSRSLTLECSICFWLPTKKCWQTENKIGSQSDWEKRERMKERKKYNLCVCVCYQKAVRKINSSSAWRREIWQNKSKTDSSLFCCRHCRRHFMEYCILAHNEGHWTTRKKTSTKMLGCPETLFSGTEGLGDTRCLCRHAQTFRPYRVHTRSW